MKKKLMTAGKTVIYAVAKWWLLVVFVAVAGILMGVRIGVVQAPENLILSVVGLMFCVKYMEQELIAKNLRAQVRYMATEIDDLENQLKFEQLTRENPASWDELRQLDAGPGVEPIGVQLARIRAANK